MATIATRTTNTGTLLVNGNIDEVTFNPSSGVKKNLLQYSTIPSAQISQSVGYWYSYCGNGSDLTNITTNTTDIAAPDGTYTALKVVRNNITSCGASTGWGLLTQQANIFTAGVTYTVSVWARVDVGSTTFSLGLNDYYQSYLGFTATTQWQRFTYTGTPSGAANTLDRGIQFTTVNQNVNIYFWGPQLEVGSTATDYVPTGALALPIPTFTAKNVANVAYTTGSFDEITYNNSSGVVKNLLSWSEYYTAWTVEDQSGWFYNTSPNQITFNAIAGPAPGSLAGKLIDMPAASGSQIQRIYTNSAPFTTGVIYTLSVYAKAAERTQFIIFHEETAGRVGINVDLTAGTISNYSNPPTTSFITPIGNGWYRVGFTFTATQTGNSVITLCRMKDAAGNATYVGDGVSGLYLWGAQLEASSSATIYQGTGLRATPIVFGSSATRLTPSFVSRKDNLGGIYATGIFDEVTGAPVVDTSVKLWIDANQTTSYPGTGTTWTDLSGTSNSLTLTSSPTFNSTLGGGAITFDGAANYAVKTTSIGVPSAAQPFTLSAWFYPTSSATAMRVVSYGTENTGQLVSIRLNAGGAYVVGFAHWGGAGYDVGNGSTVNGNTWNNVIEVFDGVNDYMYINGVLVGTFTPNALNISANSDFYVGKRATGEFFAGSVGQVMLYNRALTADEVAQTFNALRRRYNI